MGKAWQGALLTIALAALAACGERARLPVAAGIGPQPVLPPPNKTLLPTVNIAPARGWPEGATPTAAPGPRSRQLRRGARSSALAVRAAQRRRAGRRDQCAAPTRERRGPQGLGDEALDEPGRRRGAERRPHHAAARRRRRRRRGPAHGVPRRPAFAVRHGAGGRRPLRRQHRRPGALPVRGGGRTDRRAGRDRRRAAGRPDQPALDQERGREPGRRSGSTSPSARTATSPRTALRRRRGARRSGRSIPRAAATGSSPPACAIRWASRSSPRPARSGPP